MIPLLKSVRNLAAREVRGERKSLRFVRLKTMSRFYATISLKSCARSSTYLSTNWLRKNRGLSPKSAGNACAIRSSRMNQFGFPTSNH